MTSRLRSHRWYVLSALLLVYVLNFIDRQMIGILAPSIKAEMHLSDTELGLLTGLSFALMYSISGIPIAWFADRHSRVRVIATALAVWSAFTALCGVAQNYFQLFAARLGVGIGEAGGAAPAFSVISDYFPPASRAKALAIFGLGVPIGIATGVLLGAAIAGAAGWRAAFLVVGVVGLMSAGAFYFTVGEPVRGQFDPVANAASPRFKEVVRHVFSKPSFWGLVIGGSLSTALIYGLAFWLPSYFSRSFHLSLKEVSYLYSTQIIIGYSAGTLFGGWLGDKWGPRRPSMYAMIPAIGFALAIPFYAAAMLVTSPVLATALMIVPQALSSAWVGPVVAAVQRLSPPTMRTTTSALYLMLQNLIGLGGGAFFLGYLSDRYTAQYGQDSLRYSILTGLTLFALSAVVYAVTARRLHKDMI